MIFFCFFFFFKQKTAYEIMPSLVGSEMCIRDREERRQFTAENLLDVIVIPGFSTSEEVSGVSGRGVGMDFVKARAESLGGFVILDTAVGRGTKVTLKLPLTLAIVQALMVEVADETYAIPLGTVRETQVIDPTEIRTCLLYTSDAADDLLCVDLGGRRIIQKKKNK